MIKIHRKMDSGFECEVQVCPKLERKHIASKCYIQIWNWQVDCLYVFGQNIVKCQMIKNWKGSNLIEWVHVIKKHLWIDARVSFSSLILTNFVVLIDFSWCSHVSALRVPARSPGWRFTARFALPLGESYRWLWWAKKKWSSGFSADRIGSYSNPFKLNTQSKSPYDLIIHTKNISRLNDS